jgi:GT2 family glycosyltransferase
MYVPDAVVHHVGSATTGGQHSDFSVYYGHRNLVWTFVKNMPGALFWLLLPIHLLLNLASVGVFMARGQGGVILCAKWDAVKGLPQAWAKRKQIQAGRVAKVREIWRGLDKRLLPGKGY